jgi:UTP--glucose-1-phosphate uridylyltransferase
LITKAVIPAAGRGTRLLPATYALPKEMLPCGKKPTIQYVVEELAAAGVKDILIITGRAKGALVDHFDIDDIFIEKLKNSGNTVLLEEMQNLEKLNVQIKYYFTRQAQPTGLADAIYLAKDFVGADPFFVALGDTIIISTPLGHYLNRLAQLYAKQSAIGIIGLEKVSREEVEKYGIIKGTEHDRGTWEITDVIEKPKMALAPSQVAICGRYIFTPEIFQAIEKTSIGIGNEKQLTDAIKILIEEKNTIWGLEMDKIEKRYDIGNPFTYAVAFLELSLLDPMINKQLRPYLKDLAKKI